jgi:hypothetical protein
MTDVTGQAIQERQAAEPDFNLNLRNFEDFFKMALERNSRVYAKTLYS